MDAEVIDRLHKRVKLLAAEPLLAFGVASGLLGAALKELHLEVRRDPAVTLQDALPRLLEGAYAAPIAEALKRYLGQLENDSEARALRQLVVSPPDGRDQVLRWCQRHQLPVSIAPARSELDGWAPPELLLKCASSTTVLHLAAGDRPPLLDEAAAARVQQVARTYLVAKALKRRAPASPDRPSPAPPLSPPVARTLAHPSLEGLVRLLRRRALLLQDRPPLPRGAVRWGIQDLELFWEMTDAKRLLTVSVDLGEYPESIGVKCHACRDDRCLHAAAALADLDGALHQPLNHVHERLVEALGRPRWGEALSMLDRFARAATLASERQFVPEAFSWRLEQSRYYGWRLVPLSHHLLKRGGWSKGRPVSMGELLQRSELDPKLRRVAEILGGTAEVRLDRLVPALLLLAGSPDLRWEGAEVPLQVRRGALSLELLVANRTLAIVPRLDGARVGLQTYDPRFLLSAPKGGSTAFLDGRYLLLVDFSGPSATCVELTAAQERLLTAVLHLPPLPEAALDDLVPRLAAFEQHFPLVLPPSLEGERVEEDRRVVLRLTPASDGTLGVDLRVRPLGDGASRVPGSPPARITGERDKKRVHVVRDLAAETTRAQALLQALRLEEPEAPDPWARRLFGDAALDLVAALQERTDVVLEWPAQVTPLRIAGQGSAKGLKVKVEARKDWFGVNGELQIGDESVSLAAVLDAVRRGSGYVELGPGRWAQLAQDLRARLQRASDVVYAGRSGLEIGVAGSAALSDLLDSEAEVQLCASWRALTERMKSAQASEPQLPAGLQARLRPYQEDGFRWLMRMAHWGVGACLADDMGLGKTLQALAVALARKDAGPTLVVAPTSVGFNWRRECERFTPGLRPVVFREGNRAATLASLAPGDLLICSYGLLVLHAEELKQVRFGTLVLDEAQAIKNADTRRARAARDLQADFRLALTGTPMENHLGELWSLLRVLTPGLLGSWDQFRERFATPIEKQKDARQREALARAVRPFILRRTKGEVATDLPSRTELRRTVVLSQAERVLYEEARAEAVARLSGAVGGGGGGADGRFAVLAALTRLRQLACHPRLADPGSKVPSAKLKELVSLMEQLKDEGHRALVFSQFTAHLALVRDAFEEAGLKYLYLDGATPEHERAQRVDRFQAGEGDAFLISLKAGGTGLNLTAADYVIHLDPWWNPAVEDQATDRAHRIGQVRPVTVYRLVAAGTIEEAILSLHDDKRDLVAGVLGGSGSAARLSTDELLALIQGAESAESDTASEESERYDETGASEGADGDGPEESGAPSAGQGYFQASPLAAPEVEDAVVVEEPKGRRRGKAGRGGKQDEAAATPTAAGPAVKPGPEPEHEEASGQPARSHAEWRAALRVALAARKLQPSSIEVYLGAFSKTLARQEVAEPVGLEALVQALDAELAVRPSAAVRSVRGHLQRGLD